MIVDLLVTLVEGVIGDKVTGTRERRAAAKRIREHIEAAIGRFRRDYGRVDPEMVAVLLDQAPVLDLAGPKAALRELVLRPARSDPDATNRFIAAVAKAQPGLPSDRLESALRSLISCVQEELQHLPELTGAYAIALQRDTIQSLERVADAVGRRAVVSEQPQSGPRHNVPNRTFADFVGRTSELEQLRKVLRPYPDSRYFTAVVDGIGGVGKTSLVNQLAHEYIEHHDQLREPERFDAIVWVSAKRDMLTAAGIVQRPVELRGLADLYRALFIVLGRDELCQQPDDAHRTIATDLLAKNRVLLVIDNLETVDDEELEAFLRDVPDPTKVVVTSRKRIDAAVPIRLTGLAHDDARALIRSETRLLGLTISDAEAAELVRRTGGVPLGIRWSLGLLTVGHQIGGVLRRLGSGQNDIVQFCFAESLGTLRGSPGFDLLLTLSLFESEARQDVLAAASGLEDDPLAVDDSLAQLLGMSLINQLPAGYGLLPLTRRMCEGELRNDPPTEARLRSTWIAALVSLGRGYDGPEYQWRNLRALRQHGPHFETAYCWAQATGRIDLMLSFAQAHLSHLDMHGRWDELVRVALEIESYALSVGDLPRRLDAFWYHTWVLGQRGRAAEAIDILNSLEREITTPTNRAQFLHCMSQSKRWSGDLAGALASSNEALTVIDQIEVEHRDIIRASTIFELGKIARDSEDWDAAERYFQEAAKIFDLDQVAETLDDAEDPSEAKVFAFSLDRALGLLGNLGYVQYRRGNYRAALDPLRRSLMYFREHGSLSNITTATLRLAATELALGLAEATNHLTEAKQGANKLGLLVELTWIAELEHH